MSFVPERSDGLLRGSRRDRVRQIEALQGQPWNLGTLFDLHCGLLDHGHEVNEAAMDTLAELARKNPAPIVITPAALLAALATEFTVASGVDVRVVQCLSELGTAEANAALRELLESGRGNNEQFRTWTMVLTAANRHEILRDLAADRLSPKRKQMVKQALEGLPQPHR